MVLSNMLFGQGSFTFCEFVNWISACVVALSKHLSKLGGGTFCEKRKKKNPNEFFVGLT